MTFVGSPGCSVHSGIGRKIHTNQHVDNFVTGIRHRRLAEKAWKRCNGRFRRCGFPQECKAGFIAGYLDVAGGGNGCVPAIAPREYWGWQYQSPQGHKAVNTWFQAYPAGVQAAEQDGVGNWVQITPSRHPAPTPVAVHEAVVDPFGVPVEIEQGSATRSGSSTRVVEPNHDGSATRSGGAISAADPSSAEGSSSRPSGKANYDDVKSEGSGSKEGSSSRDAGDESEPLVIPLDKPNFGNLDPFSLNGSDPSLDGSKLESSYGISPVEPVFEVAELPTRDSLELDDQDGQTEITFGLSDFTDDDIEEVFGGGVSTETDTNSLPFSFE